MGQRVVADPVPFGDGALASARRRAGAIAADDEERRADAALDQRVEDALGDAGRGPVVERERDPAVAQPPATMDVRISPIPVDLAVETLARREVSRRVAGQADARRGAGEDHVAGQQGVVRESRATSLPTETHQVAGAAALHLLAVDGAPEREVVRVVALVRRDQPRADRAEAGERLAQAELRRRAGDLQTRSEMSWPTVTPGDVRPGRRPPDDLVRPRPMTTTSSTSQSMLPPGGSTTSAVRTGEAGRRTW